MPAVEAFERAMQRLRKNHPRFEWQADFADVVVIIAQVQLALRHPNNPAQSAARATLIIREWIALLEAAEPQVGELLRLGFDPAHDHNYPTRR